jgi:alkanesulfonate monooxygenase
MISTFDQLSGGRILINLIAGASDEEARAESIRYSKEERYQLMEEEVEILKQLWMQPEPVDYTGRFYELQQAQIRPRIFQQPHPPFYLGGGSKQAWQMSAKHANVHLFWGDHPERIATQIEDIRALAHDHGRAEQIGFGMRLQIICRENERDAWDAAHSLIEGASEKHLEMIRSMFSVSEANRRMRELAESEDHMIAPNLWSGITTVRPGAGVAVVGDPEQCAATLQSFIDVGCSSFCLSGYLHHDEAKRFGERVRPILAANNPGRLSP